MLTTAGAAGTRSRASSFAGGTSVTPWDDHSCWHPGETSVNGVVVVTPAHAEPAEPAVDAATVDLGVTPLRGAGEPQALTVSSQQPINTAVASPLTTSPETLAALHGRRTPGGGSAIDPSRGEASMAVRPGGSFTR
jgi:hypothetical protein